MLQHYLLLSYRTFLRFKGSFFINLISLSTGLTCSILIYLWVQDELSVDKFHKKDSRLYQVVEKTQTNVLEAGERLPGRLAEALKAEIPEIETAIPVFRTNQGNGTTSSGDAYVKAKDWFVGQDFFTLFTYPLLQGDKDKVLQDKYGVAISDELARKLFNTTRNIVGKSIQWEKDDFSGTYLISGIFQKPPLHSTAQFDILFNFELKREKHTWANEWNSGNCFTYVLLKPGVDIGNVNAKISGFIKKKDPSTATALFIRPYSDKYLYNYENGVRAGGRIEYVRLFSIIALFILLIACINFMNLSTAKATRRMKEVGIKKAIGANRKVLVLQFLGESLAMAFVSLLLSLLFAFLFIPNFNDITGKNLSLYTEFSFIPTLVGITLITGFIAGSYPALYLSGFKSALVLKGKLPTSAGEAWIRKGLVVFQFTLSILLIVSVVIVYGQIQLIQTKNLGYTRDNIILFKKEGKLRSNLETFLQEVKSMPGVVNASNTWTDMTRADSYTNAIEWEGKSADDKLDFAGITGNYDLIETLGIQLSAGRTFSRKFASDSAAIILNEAALAITGLKDPIGKIIRLKRQDRQIIGVVKNFHFESLYEPMKPCLLVLDPTAANILVKIKEGRQKETLERIQKNYEAYNQGLPFEFTFLDESYQELYVAEQRVGVLSQYFACIAIVISCLGLFGLAAFTAERRRKEIDIRKVLGSGEWSIIRLLSGEFTRLVLISMLIALPMSYLLAKEWLNNFAFSIELEWWFFAGAGILALLIAWLTVGTQALKAARLNPIQILRDE